MQRAGRKVRSMGYRYDVDGYASPDMAVLAEHITSAFIQSGELVLLLDKYPVADVWLHLHIPEDRLELSHVQALRTHLQSGMKTPELVVRV